MNYSGRIMNIRSGVEGDASIEYNRGHRDARHAAAEIAVEAENQIDQFKNAAFRAGAMMTPPCFVCGYNGRGYFQPDTHPCAKKHHKLFIEK